MTFAEDADRLPLNSVARRLNQRLGSKLTAEIGGRRSSSTARRWARGASKPSDAEAEGRLRLALKVVETVYQPASPSSARVWLTTLHPQLDDRAPLEILASAGWAEHSEHMLKLAHEFSTANTREAELTARLQDEYEDTHVALVGDEVVGADASASLLRERLAGQGITDYEVFFVPPLDEVSQVNAAEQSQAAVEADLGR